MTNREISYYMYMVRPEILIAKEKCKFFEVKKTNQKVFIVARMHMRLHVIKRKNQHWNERAQRMKTTLPTTAKKLCWKSYKRCKIPISFCF